MKRLFIALFTLLAFAAPADAAITLANLGQHSVASSATNQLTTAVNACAAGSTIVVQVSQSTGTLSSVADSAGNTYQTPLDNIAGTTINIAFAYAINTNSNLAAGGTITLTMSASSANAMQAVCLQGLSTTAPLDTSNHTAQGAATTSASSVATGALADTNEIILATLGNPTAPGSVTCGGSYTKIAFNGTPSINLCYQIVASSSSVAFAPTWVNSVTYVTDVISMKTTGGGAPPVVPSLTLTGAGS